VSAARFKFVPRSTCRRVPAPAGFSLLEVLVAITILLVALTVLAQVSAIATRANTTARTTSITTLLAVQKMEQLRALTWGFDASGNPSSDTTTDIAIVPPRPNEGVGLSPSPGGTLEQNTPGYCDFVDATGRSLGGDGAAAAGAIFARRWSIEPLPAVPDTLVLQVVVTRLRTSVAGPVKLLPDEARLIGAKTRTVS
jgi:prepilin-type N-terminal cleavage/methylation domain-containing protein